MACYNIMAIIVNYRTKKAPDLQTILTKYGCMIKMRLGLHETESVCSEEGLIILQLSGEKKEIKRLEDELSELEGVSVKHMEVCS